jgi:hypothetical protein
VLSGQPPDFPSNNGTTPAGTVTHPAASGRLIVILRQAIHSHFARVANVFRRKNSSSTYWYSAMRTIADLLQES